MFRINKSVEKIQVGQYTYLGDFESGALIKLDNQRETMMNGFDAGKEFEQKDFESDPQLFEELLNGGYFDSISQPLSTAYLHVTNICNLNCIGCYSYDRTRNCSDKLSFENIKYIIDQLINNGVETITISGGEPLIRKDIVDIVKYAKEKGGVRVLNLITNGTVYDETQLLGLKPYLDALAVSIDGYNSDNPHFLRDVGTFPKVIESVEKLRDMGFPVSILPTLHKQNIDAIEEYLKLSKQLNVPISFSLMTCSEELSDYIPTDQNLHDLVDFLLDYMKSGKVPLQDYSELEARKNCGAGSSIISVTAEGNVYPCHMMHDTDTLMGNIMEKPLSEILCSSVPLPPVEEVEKCNDCEMRNLCGGGCKARALLINGSWNKPDPYCEMNRHFYTQFVKENNGNG